MTEIRSRARQLSLSVTGILVLVLLVSLACIPQELRADAASRIAGLAEYVDTVLTDAWLAAFPLRGPDNRTSASANKRSGSNLGASLVLTGGAASATSDAGLIDITGFGPGSFGGGYGAGSASNSMGRLLADMLKEGNPESSGGFDPFGSGGGNDFASSGGAGVRHSGGTGASTNGAAPAGASGASSNKGTSQSSAASHGRSSEGTLHLAAVRLDTHRERVTGLRNGVVSDYDVAGPSWQQVASSQPLNGLFSDQPGNSDGGGGPHDGSTGDGGDPTAGDPTGPSGNGQGDPLPGPGSGSGGNGGTDSGGGDEQPPGITSPVANDPPVEDQGPVENPVTTTDPGPGPVSSVPEPASWVLLSLALGAVVLWRKFRSAG